LSDNVIHFTKPAHNLVKFGDVIDLADMSGERLGLGYFAFCQPGFGNTGKIRP
jgi:hypothetical protein